MKRKYAVLGLIVAISMVSTFSFVYSAPPLGLELDIQKDGGNSIWTVKTNAYPQYTFEITSVVFYVGYYDVHISSIVTTIQVDAMDALIEETSIDGEPVLTFKLAGLRQLAHESAGEVDDPYTHSGVITTAVRGNYYDLDEVLQGTFVASGPAWRWTSSKWLR